MDTVEGSEQQHSFSEGDLRGEEPVEENILKKMTCKVLFTCTYYR